MMYPIILIGPVRAGKSTVGKLLAQRLARVSASLDDHYSRYRGEAKAEVEGPDAEQRARWINDGNWLELIKSEQPSYALILKRFLSDYRDAVIDLGAGHSVYDMPIFDEVSALLRPIENVILLLPTPDPQESIGILRGRLEYPLHIALNPYFINHPANALLARHTVYTKGKSPLETCEEILELVRPSGSP